MKVTRARLVGAIALVFLCVPHLGQAQEKAKEITVRRLAFTGVEQVNESQLRSVLATRVSSRLPWGRKERFDRDDFEADLERIHAFYVDRGFPDARVASFDIDLNEAGDQVSLSIHVTEGQPIRVAELRFEGFDALPPEERGSLARRAPLKQGQPFDRAALATSREVAANALRDHGFPYPEISARRDSAGAGPDVVISIVAQPGTRAYFGQTTVEGSQAVGEKVVLRSLLFKPGDLYRLSVLRESQRKLYSLELFEFVNVAPVQDAAGNAAGNANGSATSKAQTDSRQVVNGQLPQAEDQGDDPVGQVVPMKVTVTDAKHQRLRFSVGYGTEENVRAEVQYRRLNFLGGARSGGVHAKWSAIERGVRADFREPHFFGPRWSASLDVQQWYADELIYRAISSGGNFTVAYQPGTLNTFSVTGTSIFQSSRISNEALEDLSLRDELIALGLDPRTGMQDGLLNAVSFDAQRNTSDNPLNATRGYAALAHVERAVGVLGGDYRYWNLTLDLRHYQKLGSLVLATRGRAGMLAPAQGLGANVPFAKRYFLGGSTSLRGWGRYEVSPLSGSGLPIGGFSMFEGSVETRAPLVGKLTGVAFLDAGNVWADAWDLNFDDLRYSVGLGLRYQTPIGPIRFDFGYQLNPIPGLLIEGKPETRRWRVHVSIGQAF
jgi:outer membrane protein insertion porin family/translocation and assembly module TamA